jgi:hypothetical protein
MSLVVALSVEVSVAVLSVLRETLWFSLGREVQYKRSHKETMVRNKAERFVIRLFMGYGSIA